MPGRKYRIRLVLAAFLLIYLPLALCFHQAYRLARSIRIKGLRRPDSSRLYHGAGGGGGGDGLSTSGGASTSSSSSAEASSPSPSSGEADAVTLVLEGNHFVATTAPVETTDTDASLSSAPDHHDDNPTESSASSPVSMDQNSNIRFVEQDLKNATTQIVESSSLDGVVSLPEEGEMETGLSRRDALRRTSTLLVAGTLIGGGTCKHQWDVIQASSKKVGDLNFTRIIRETSIDICVDGPMNREFLNAQTFQKVQSLKLPGWVPSFLVPAPRVIHDTTNVELVTAAAIAGSIVEMGRTSLLYPLLTLKTRVQTDVNVRFRKRKIRSRQRLHLRRRLQVAQLLARKHVREGSLYAGIWPSLLVSVPATGVYFGVRDVVMRKLVPYTDALGGSISVALLAALAADVVSLLIRTPADTLAVRLQAATGEEFQWEDSQNRPILEAERRAYLQERIGNWFLESLERIPTLILTDLPYLLSRIALIRVLMQGGTVSLGRYEGIVLFSALLCGFLTTPFDVARTRILIDSDDDPTNGLDGGSGDGLLRTFEKIQNEGDGGVRNLFAGWIERVAYLGIGRAWIEPLQILGYIAIRDFILLEWF